MNTSLVAALSCGLLCGAAAAGTLDLRGAALNRSANSPSCAIVMGSLTSFTPGGTAGMLSEPTPLR